MKEFVSQNKGVLVLASVFFLMGGEAIFKLMRAERYGLTVAFLIAVTLLGSAFVSSYGNSKRPSKHASYITRLWEMPIEITRTGLWMKAGIVVLMGISLYFGLMYDTWIDDDGKINLAIVATSGMKVLLWLPLLYWLFRRQYTPASLNQDDDKLLLRKIDDPPKPSSQEMLVALFVFGIAFVALSIIGMWLR